MRYGSKGTSLHSPHSSPASQLRGWDDRIAYFMGIMRNLGYSDDEDEEMNPPFVPLGARPVSPFQRGGGTTLFEPNKVKVQGRTSQHEPKRVAQIA